MVREITRTAEALVPCTCGELVQGTLGGLPFLVSCPVDRYSRVRVNIAVLEAEGDKPLPYVLGECAGETRELPGTCHQAGGEPGGNGKHLKSSTAKALKAAALTLEYLGLRSSPFSLSIWPEIGCTTRASFPPAAPSFPTSTPSFPRKRESRALVGGVDWTPAFAGVTKKRPGVTKGRLSWAMCLEVSCPLPPSKGFGTSSADVVGAISAVAEAAGGTLSPLEVARLAIAVEPSDGTMFPGLALFDHRGCRRWQDLGPAPPLLVVALDFEGTVDTEDYNARLDTSHLHALEKEHSRALELLITGLRSHRLGLIGEAATASARANQRLLAKPQLETTIALGRDCLSLGVCAAHSGTALGVLFAPGEVAQAKLFQKRAEERLEGLSDSWIATMVDGGARVPVTSAWKQE